jgi:hypothetical protein
LLKVQKGMMVSGPMMYPFILWLNFISLVNL